MVDNNICLICGNSEFKNSMELKDHMVSKKKFTIQECISCGFQFTNPRPSENEIGSYYKSENYVSHSSSKKGLINSLYNIVRRKTLQTKVSWLNRNVLGKKLLDIGCGTGHFLDLAKKKGYEVTGLEPDEDAREFAKKHHGIETLPLETLYELANDSFDAITMWHVLEHVYNLKEDVNQICNILKPNGFLYIAVPNRSSWDAGYYNKYWAAYDVPRHLYHFRKEDVVNLFNSKDLQLKEVIPMKFDAYYVSMLSEKYKKGSFIMGFWNGLRSNIKSEKGGYSSQVYVFEKKN